MVRINTPSKKGIRFEMKFSQFLVAVLIFGSIFVIPSYVYESKNTPSGNVAGAYTESFYEAGTQLNEFKTGFIFSGFMDTLKQQKISLLTTILITGSSVLVALTGSALVRFYKVSTKLFDD